MLSVLLISSLSDYISESSQSLSLFPVPVPVYPDSMYPDPTQADRLKAQHLPAERQIDDWDVWEVHLTTGSAK